MHFPEKSFECHLYFCESVRKCLILDSNRILLACACVCCKHFYLCMRFYARNVAYCLNPTKIMEMLLSFYFQPLGEMPLHFLEFSLSKLLHLSLIPNACSNIRCLPCHKCFVFLVTWRIYISFDLISCLVIEGDDS